MQSAADNFHETSAWYRRFWVWVAIALPTSVVIAGFVTLWLALRFPDAEVSAEGIHEAANSVVGRNSVAPPKR